MAHFRDVLKKRNFFLLWLGQIISQLGDRLNQMALIGFIAQRSPGETFELATLLSFTIMPVFVVGPIAGVYVDRWDRRKTMYVCDFLRGLLVLCIPVFVMNRNLPVVWLYLAVFLLFSIGRFFVPAKMAIVPDLVDKDQLLLANSLVNTTGMIAATFGFAIGGIIVAVLGVKGGFYIDSASFFISSLLIFFINIKSKSNIKIGALSKEIVEVIRKSVFSEVKEGVVYVLRQTQMRTVIGTLFLVWAALGAVYVVIIVFIQSTLKSFTLDLGLLIMFLGIGLFSGSLIYGRFGKTSNCFQTIHSSLFVSGLALAAFAFFLEKMPYFYTAAFLVFIFGAVVAPIMTATNTLVHDVATDKMRGKVFSSIEVVMHLAFLMFMLLGSSLAEIKKIGRGNFLIAVGILISAIGLVSYLRLKVKELSKQF